MAIKRSRQKKQAAPRGLVSLLLEGYSFNDDSEHECQEDGGLLGLEFQSGTYTLTNNITGKSDVLLPYKARLIFGEPIFAPKDDDAESGPKRHAKREVAKSN